MQFDPDDPHFEKEFLRRARRTKRDWFRPKPLTATATEPTPLIGRNPPF